MADKQHPIRNGIIASITSATIVGFVTHFTVGWQNVFQAIGQAWKWFGSPVPIRMWILLALIAMGIGFVICVLLFFFDSSEQKTPQELSEITVQGVRWRAMDLHFNHVLPFCSNCDLQIRPRNAGFPYRQSGPVTYQCESCGERLVDDRNHEQMVDYITRRMQIEVRDEGRRRQE